LEKKKRKEKKSEQEIYIVKLKKRVSDILDGECMEFP